MLAARRIGVVALPFIAFFCVLGSAFQAPLPPAVGPDPSWMVALGEAARERFVFGRDIIYTWGPLGYLDIPAVVRHTYAPKMLFALAIACACALIVLLRLRSEGRAWQRIAFLVAALIIFPYHNALYLVGEGDARIFILLAIVFTFPAFNETRPMRLAALSLGLLAGFFSLIKFSLFVALVILGTGTFGARVIQHRRLSQLRGADIEAACLYVLGLCLSSAGIYFWIGYGFCYQTGLAALGAASGLLWIGRSRAWAFVTAACAAIVVVSTPYRHYLYYSLQIAGGYSSAVSRETHTNALPMGLLFLAFGTLLAISESAALGAGRLFAVIAVLFITFRQGFVRQDPTHTVPYFIAASFVGCILLLAAKRSRTPIYAALLILLSLPVLPPYLNYGQVRVPIVTFPSAILDGLTGVFQTIADVAEKGESIDGNGQWLAPDALDPSVKRRLKTEPVDLVGRETNIVFANDLAWKPRPAFLAPYSVFAPALDAWNRDSVRAQKTGRELLTDESIQDLYPLGDEPLTTRELLCNYTTDRSFSSNVTTQGGTSLIVLLRAPGRCGSSAVSGLDTLRWNQWLRPAVEPGRLAFLFIDFRYSLAGKVIKSLYEITPVSMIVHYRSGSTVTYRVIPELLGGGLLVNPIPRDVTGVRALFAGRNADPVDEIRFTTQREWLFSPRMDYRIAAVPYR